MFYSKQRPEKDMNALFLRIIERSEAFRFFVARESGPLIKTKKLGKCQAAGKGIFYDDFLYLFSVHDFCPKYHSNPLVHNLLRSPIMQYICTKFKS